jgi:hypothetical protein
MDHGDARLGMVERPSLRSGTTPAVIGSPWIEERVAHSPGQLLGGVVVEPVFEALGLVMPLVRATPVRSRNRSTRR